MRDAVFSCNDAGVPFLKVAVYSLLSRYAGEEPLRVNVFEGWGGHSALHKAEVGEIVSRFPGAVLRYVDVQEAVRPYENSIAMRKGSRWNIFTWTPVFTPMLLPDATGNVIHFDIDMLFNADVSPLFEIDLSGDGGGEPYLASCAYEYDRYGDNAGRIIWDAGILPPEAERYFNTGVLVLNSDACRKERTWEKIVGWYRDNVSVADRIEQDAWNALYWRRIKPLHVKWNFHDRNIKGYSHWPLSCRYWLGNPPRECLEAAVNPSVLHFWGPKKPWKPSHRPYRKLYHEAMKAVGLPVPREQVLAPVHDYVNRCRMKSIREVLKIPEKLYGFLKTDRSAFSRKMMQVGVVRGLRGMLLLPFEWLGVALGLMTIPFLGRKIMLAVCDVAGAVMYAFDRRGRRRSLENLHVLTGKASGNEGTFLFEVDKAPYRPSPRERKIIRGAYRNMARTVGHAFWTSRSASGKVREAGEMGEECRRLLRENKTAVTVSGHIGCWEMLSQLAQLEGHCMISVAKNIGTRGMTYLLMKARRSIGQEIVPSEGAFKALMAGVRAGKSIGLLVDQRVSPAEGGVWVRFCGRPVPVSVAPAFFAAKARVPIIVAWSRPLPSGRYRCELADVITPAEARNAWGTAQRCASVIERIVRRHPSRWLLNYNMYGTFPHPDDIETLSERERSASRKADRSSRDPSERA